ncbi:hypothetical protein CBER1_10728 [Cercospora berteroae]|uniref:Suppressor of anucleate metulae protein B n=1 Tax=Cercospora berteroae TaxID=357750 RepID=A0A2S6CKT1_9PEZI|nr:hypothetical protein CBER1_10728 [Cercospora berteroae]
MASTTTRPPPAGGTTSNTDCNACGSVAPRPHLTCFECTEGVDVHGNVDSIQYCTARCRDLAATEHKGDCERRNVRKQIYRVGELLQSSFYRLQDLNFITQFSQTKKEKGTLYYFEVAPWHRKTVFETSPYKFTETANDAHAIMSAFRCDLALGTHFELSKKLLAGISKYIEEVGFDGVAGKLKAKLVYPNGRVHDSSCGHEVLCVQTHADESYVIDITGAQYGQYEAVLPLETAVSFYGNKLSAIWPHGHYSVDLLAETKRHLAGGTGVSPRDRIIPAYLATLFNKLLIAWEKSHATRVDTLLKAKQAEYKLLEGTIEKLVVEASLQGRLVLRKVPPIEVFPLIDYADNVQGALGKPVVTVISKEYTGSRVAKKYRRHVLNTERRERPERWKDVIQPTLASNRSINVGVDVESRTRERLSSMKAEHGQAFMTAQMAMMDKAASYWTNEALAN